MKVPPVLKPVLKGAPTIGKKAWTSFREKAKARKARKGRLGSRLFPAPAWNAGASDYPDSYDPASRLKTELPTRTPTEPAAIPAPQPVPAPPVQDLSESSGSDPEVKHVLSSGSPRSEDPPAVAIAPSNPAPVTRNFKPTKDWVWTAQSGTQGRVVEVGQGTPIVFLHGLVGLNEHWEGVVERIHPHVRCVMFELPLLQLRGEEASIHGVTALTAEFLKTAFDEPAVLVGNSFGGHVALRLALQHADLVRALVLAGSSGLIEKSIVSDVQIRPSREWLSRKIGELFFDPGTHMREADLDRAHRELSDRGGARAMVKLSRSARRDHLGERIGEITRPTLLLWGRQDIVTPPEAAEGFHRMIKTSEIVWFDQCGHTPMIEAADGFSKALLDFTRRLPR